jgi:hypothetical protein
VFCAFDANWIDAILPTARPIHFRASADHRDRRAQLPVPLLPHTRRAVTGMKRFVLTSTGSSAVQLKLRRGINASWAGP